MVCSISFQFLVGLSFSGKLVYLCPWLSGVLIYAQSVPVTIIRFTSIRYALSFDDNRISRDMLIDLSKVFLMTHGWTFVIILFFLVLIGNTYRNGYHCNG